MLTKITNSQQTPARTLELLRIIGDLKIVNFPLLKTVKNPTLNRVGTKKFLTALLTENLLELTDKGNYRLSVKSFELLKKNKIRTEHMVEKPPDSDADHAWAVRRFLLPIMFWDTYHCVGYKRLSDHGLEPDAILFFYCPKDGYQIVFVEVEETDKGSQYLIEKRDKYISLGSDFSTWDAWWRKWHGHFGLPFCRQEEFKFSVWCRGTQTFEMEGWEWV